MGTTTIEYQVIPGTRASVGRSGAHSVIADRPQGRAGGMGLGFNGGELLALSLGGCFCNDMQAIADDMGLTIADLQVSVDVDFDGDPVRATDARLTVRCTLADGSDPAELIERARADTTIGNSVSDGIPFSINGIGNG
jgi:organic hydroperoxide reductase OsmC/OhrA